MDSTGHVNKLTFHPASLPEWLSNIPESNINTIYTVGISDPGMEASEALQLAVLRAKIISALLIQPKISSITDNYSTEKQSTTSDQFTTKYVNYYRILASLNGSPGQFELIDQYVTSFNETIVLMKYYNSIAHGSVVDSVMLKIDYYQAERQRKNRFEFEEKCEVYGLSKQNNSDEEINLFYYYFRAVNQFYEIVSRYNGEDLDFPRNIFRYQGLAGSDMKKEDNLNFSYKLTYGLWKAYLEALLQSFTVANVNSGISVGSLGDTYSSTMHNLSREVSESDPVFRIKGFEVNNNRLSVILNRMN